MHKQDKEILLSIIIPVYNGEKTLKNCLNSILKQNSTKLEIILINDHSKDESKQICYFYEKKFKNIKVYNQSKNQGVSACRNKGIEKAKGKFLFFLDSDDFILKNCISKIIKSINNNFNSDLIIAKKFVVLSWKNKFLTHEVFKKKFNKNKSNQLITELSKEKNIYGQIYNYIINKKFLLKNKIRFILGVNFAEDQEFVIRLLCFGKKFSFYDNPYYCHCAGAGNLTNVMTMDSGLSCLMVANSLSKILKIKNLSKIKKNYINKVINKVLNQFIPKLIYFKKNKINKFANYIKTKNKNFKLIKYSFEKINVFSNLKKFGHYKGLLKNRKLIINKLSSLDKLEKSNKIYIFCYNYYGIAIAKSLIENGYDVKGFLDNNILNKGKKILNLSVYLPKILKNQSNKSKSATKIIISNEFLRNVKSITKQLLKFGIKEKQIGYKII